MEYSSETKISIYGSGDEWFTRLTASFVTFFLYAIILKFGIQSPSYRSLYHSRYKLCDEKYINFTITLFVCISVSWIIWVKYTSPCYIYEIDTIYTTLLIFSALWAAAFFSSNFTTLSSVLAVIILIISYYLSYRSWVSVFGEMSCDYEYPKWAAFTIFTLLAINSSYATYILVINLTTTNKQ